MKLLAENAGLSSISAENGQIVLRYPPLPDGVRQRHFPYLGPQVRASNNTLWLKGGSKRGWEMALLELLETLSDAPRVNPPA